VNIGAFSASLQDRREVWTATSISGSPNGGRAADLAIFAAIWTYCSRRLDLHACHRGSHAGAGSEARQSRPLDRAFALLDPLLARPALVVESNDALGRARQVGDDKADARIKLARMPLDFGDHPARLRPASGLIAEISIEPPDFIWRSSDRTLEQVADPALQDLVGRKPDRIFDPLGFQKTRRPRASRRLHLLENRYVRLCPGSASRRA
jgi:hypothetical protein